MAFWLVGAPFDVLVVFYVFRVIFVLAESLFGVVCLAVEAERVTIISVFSIDVLLKQTA